MIWIENQSRIISKILVILSFIMFILFNLFLKINRYSFGIFIWYGQGNGIIAISIYLISLLIGIFSLGFFFYLYKKEKKLSYLIILLIYLFIVIFLTVVVSIGSFSENRLSYAT